MIALDNSKQEHLLDILRRHEKKLRRFDGVYDVGVGYVRTNGKIDHNEIGILVYVVKKFGKEELDKNQVLPAVIEGIRVDVIQTTPKEQAVPTDRFEPLLGGISISNIRMTTSGTLGMIVKDKDSGIPLGLTNHHVIKGKRGRRRNPIVQPEWKPNTREFRIGNVYRWNWDLDCAVFKIKTKLRAIDSENSMLNIEGKVTGIVEPLIGMEVMKSGATSGVTHGIISSISSTLVNIRISSNPNKWDKDNEISLPGDSGSVWITDSDDKKAVGLHHSGDSLDTPLTEYALAVNLRFVFEKLNLTI